MDAKSTKFRSPWPKWKTLLTAPLWRTGDKGAPPLPQTLAVRKQLQRKVEAPSSAPSQTQLSNGDVINVSKSDEQGIKYALTACRIENIEETPPGRFRDLQYPLWIINADLFIEYDSPGFVPKWLFDVMMLGKDVIFYGEAMARNYMPLKGCTFLPSFYLSVCTLCTSCPVFVALCTQLFP